MTTFHCGHEKTPENSRPSKGYAICKYCNNSYHRQYRYWSVGRPVPDTSPVYGRVADRIVALLRQHPDGLEVRALWAKLGYHHSVDSIGTVINYHRHRHGLPVVSVRLPGRERRVKYRLEPVAS